MRVTALALAACLLAGCAKEPERWWYPPSKESPEVRSDIPERYTGSLTAVHCEPPQGGIRWCW